MKAKATAVLAVLSVLSCTLFGLGPPSGVIDGTVSGRFKQVHVYLTPFGHNKGLRRSTASENWLLRFDSFHFRFDSLEAGTYQVKVIVRTLGATNDLNPVLVELAGGEHRTIDFPLLDGH